MSTVIPPQVQAYIDAIPAGHRPLFDRLHRLILTAHPAAEVTLSYQMPTYMAGKRRLYLGAWRHGISVYGWGDRDGGFAPRHPDLVTGKGTIRLRPQDAAGIGDAEFLGLARAALAPNPEADEDISAGRGTVHESAEAMFDHLDSLGSADS